MMVAAQPSSDDDPVRWIHGFKQGCGTRWRVQVRACGLNVRLGPHRLLGVKRSSRGANALALESENEDQRSVDLLPELRLAVGQLMQLAQVEEFSEAPRDDRAVCIEHQSARIAQGVRPGVRSEFILGFGRIVVDPNRVFVVAALAAEATRHEIFQLGNIGIGHGIRHQSFTIPRIASCPYYNYGMPGKSTSFAMLVAPIVFLTGCGTMAPTQPQPQAQQPAAAPAPAPANTEQVQTESTGGGGGGRHKRHRKHGGGGNPEGPATQTAQSVAGNFDFYLMSLSWSPGFCATPAGQNDPGQCAPGRKFSFVLHGLWPQYEGHGWPEDCSTEQIDPAMINQMLPMMPSPKLIEHEWQKHGTCSGLNSKEYFDEAAEAFHAINIPAVYQNLATPLNVSPAEVRSQLASANPKLGGEQSIVVACSGGGRYLSEVHVCLTKDLAGRPCNRETQAAQCKSDTVLMRPVR